MLKLSYFFPLVESTCGNHRHFFVSSSLSVVTFLLAHALNKCLMSMQRLVYQSAGGLLR